MNEEQKKLDELIKRTFTDVDALSYLCEFVSLLMVIHSGVNILTYGFSIFYVILFLIGLLLIKGSRYLIEYCDKSLKINGIMFDAVSKLNKEANNDKCNKD